MFDSTMLPPFGEVSSISDGSEASVVSTFGAATGAPNFGAATGVPDFGAATGAPSFNSAPSQPQFAINSQEGILPPVSLPELPPMQALKIGNQYYWIVGGDSTRGWDGSCWVAF